MTCNLRYDCARSIGGAIVHNQDFKASMRLTLDALNCRGDRGGSIKRRNNHADEVICGGAAHRLDALSESEDALRVSEDAWRRTPRSRRPTADLTRFAKGCLPNQTYERTTLSTFG